MDSVAGAGVFGTVSAWALLAAFALGLAAIATPAGWPLAPVLVGYLGGTAGGAVADARGAFTRSLAFLGGLSLVNIVAGALFGAAGALAQQLFGGYLPLWNAVAGALSLYAALAVWRVRWLPRPALPGLPAPGSEWRPATKWHAAFLLGIPYGLITCPTCTPVLLPVALGAAATGLAWYGALLFLAFAAGRGLPLLLLGTSTGWLRQMRVLSRLGRRIEQASGALLLLAAAYFFAQAIATGMAVMEMSS